MSAMEVNNDRKERQKSYECVCGQGFTANQFCIQCDHCKEWMHGLCVGLREFEAEEIDRFYCFLCHRSDSRLVSVQKPITNNWRHNPTEPNPELKPVQTGTEKFIERLRSLKLIDAKTDDSVVKRMRGQQLTLKEMLSNGFAVPVLVDCNEGLELMLPSRNRFSYKSILDYYPADYDLDVIDVRRQLNIKMKAQDFVDCFSVDAERRPNVYNCISLEVSNRSSLSNLVRAPAIVNKLSWVENYWPAVDAKPQVSKYCLISMKNSYTDFHIDFGGTSVWYHVLNGEKVFYIIKPSKENLEKYEHWMTAPNTNEQCFLDLVGLDQSYRLCLTAGQTLLIPTGWIHAVLTPQDSLVFGGNFLHSLSIDLQLKIREMEQRIKTPDKFQFPFFEMTHWYAAPNVLKLLQDNLKQKPPKYLVEGVKALIPQLKLWQKKSKDLQSENQNDYQNLICAPKGFNCFKLIKDLNLTLKKAIRKLEGQPLVKKRGKSYKDFNLSDDNERTIGSTLISGNTSDKESPKKKLKTSNNDNESQMDLDVDRDQALVVDDSTKAANRKRSQSTDSDSKGLKLKLSISGAKEILGTNVSMDSVTNELIKTNDNSIALKSTSSANIESPKKQKNKRKPKKQTPDQRMDEEIESMVKGRPEDKDYIYLDLETAADEEHLKDSLKTTAKDESWAPKAKVTIKSTPKAPRQPRDAAKRDVVGTSIANAAAKMENMPEPKRQYVRKKVKPNKSANTSDPMDTINAVVDSSRLSASIAADSPLDDSSAGEQSSAPVGPSGSVVSNQLSKKAKKGLKTPKQRLHKIICQKKRMHF